MDFLSVLNYQGSKKNLAAFIHEHSASVLEPGQTLLDIFAGTCSVGYSFKRTNRIYANDCEEYAFIISQALLGNYSNCQLNDLIGKTSLLINQNMDKINNAYKDLIKQEAAVLCSAVASKVEKFYKSVPSVWNGKAATLAGTYDLFLRYYASSYFGVMQSAWIDSIRFAIELYKGTDLFSPLLASLYFAMKECVFAKDGHMAQPLDIEKNFSKLLKQRSKDLFNLFKSKLEDFFSDDFVVPDFENKTYHMNFEDLLRVPEIQRDVDLIYADPPYTDMQYSRYYHLLNFVTRYEPLPLTMVKGSHTKGLYTSGRYQSRLSAKSQCLSSFSTLIDFSYTFHKNLMISFAYPVDINAQKTDRYVMSVDSLIEVCLSYFGSRKVEVDSCGYAHSNNRNKEHKQVREYLIVCKS